MLKFVEGLWAWPRLTRAVSLRQALLRLILITLLPLALASAGIAWQLSSAQSNAVEDQLKDTATALSLAVDREVSGVRGQLEAVAGSRMVDEGRWQELHEFLTALARIRHGAVVAVVDHTGQLKVQTNFAYGAPLPNLWQLESKREEAVWEGHRLPLSSQGLTRRVIESGEPEVSGVYLSIVARQPVIGISVPVVRGEQVRHAIVYSFPTKALERALGETDSTTLRLTLIDRSGIVIAKSESSPEQVGDRVEPASLHDPADRKWWVVQRTAADGVPVLSALATSDLTGWTVRVSQPVTDALAPAYRAARNWLVLFGLVLAAAVALAVLLSGRLAAPLVELAHGAGSGAVPLHATGIREIDVLSERLARAAESEAQSRSELERRVAAEERERAAAESERLVRAHMADLEAADRRKDHFLAMLGHELRNPLSPILNSARLIRLAGHEPAVVEQSAQVVERQVEHLTRLIDDLLDVARITEGKIVLKRQRVELMPLVYQALEATRGLMESRAQRLTIQPPSDNVFLDADPARIVQVLTNLLTNAAKYSPEGSEVGVSARREGGVVTLRVKDSGLGIAPEMLPRLFVPFSQASDALDRSQGGLGIGLALVKRLVEMHGGTVTAASPGLGQGSEFTVTLPLATAVESRTAVLDRLPVRDSAESLRCLVVDDNVDAADSFAALLQASGHLTVVCYEAASALKRFEDGPFDLAVLDIGLPGMDGYELARRMRALEPSSRCFLAALTGYGQASDAKRASEAGFDVHLVKPLLPEALDRLLAAAVEAARTRART
jgi:signal transduction histidine kinase/ActR/RegA family two-component response regulator